MTIGVFVALTASLYPVGMWLVYRLGSATPLMLSVGAAAVLTCLLTNKGLGTLGWSWGRWQDHWLSYLLPLGYVAVAYGTIWALDLGGWYDVAFVHELRQSFSLSQWGDGQVVGLQFALTASISFLGLLPSVLGEELGWRGLLVPELSRIMPFGGVALTSGALWALWHWPLIVMGLYGSPVTPLWFRLLFFTLGIMSMSVVMTDLRLRTQSLWSAVVLHMSHNVFLQKFFVPMTDEYSRSAWWVDEFGAVLPLTIGLVALHYWRNDRTAFAP
ncbi:MAG: type II CAAX endopeptidase family protein [Vicinamibacterales bacterium]